MKEITKSLRELLTVKVKIDMNNPKYKYLHTNSFIWMELPSDILISNFESIASALNSTDSRFSGYQKNRWYVEELTITNDGEKCIGELTLNPFASSNRTYKDNYLSLMEAYTNAVEQKNNNSNKTSNTTSTTTNKTNYNKEFSSKINNLAQKIVGNETNDLKKAKLIHNWLTNNVRYKYHLNCKYCTPDKCYENRSHLACADTSILTRALMICAGLNAYIVHGPNHYWTQIKINGKAYNSDATSKSRGWNKVWKNLKVDRVCGEKPC